MICTKCNTTQKKGVQFCANCGNKMTSPQGQPNQMPLTQRQPNQMPQPQGLPNPMPPTQGQPNPMPPTQGQPNPMPPTQRQPNPMPPTQGQPNQMPPTQGQPNQMSQPQGQPSPNSLRAIDLILHLVGKNQAYYKVAFMKVTSGQKSFNWCAFFFSYALFYYHKMYKPAVAYAIPLMCLALFNSIITLVPIFAGSTFSNVFSLIVTVVGISISIRSGNNFDRLLYDHLLEVASKRESLSEADYYALEFNNTGVSSINVVPLFIPFVNFIAVIYFVMKGIDKNSKLDYHVRH